MLAIGGRVETAWGQTLPAPRPALNTDIVVLGTPLADSPGTPAYGSVTIGPERLGGDASGRLEDVLSDVAGFQQFRRADSRSANPSAQGVTLRALGGNATSRALVLLDGVPIADPFFGYIPFNAILPDGLASARVTRGGGAGAFGAGAVAGTIELTSATRADLPLVAGAASVGSFDSQSATFGFNPDLGEGFVAATGRWERSGGFFTTPIDQRVPASARARFEDWSAGLRAVVPLGPRTELQARGLVFADDRTLRFEGADSRSQGQDASIRLIHRGAWQIDAIAYLQARNFANKVISSSNFRLALDQRDTPSTGIGGKIELRPTIGAGHLLRFGADARAADGALAEDGYSTVTGAVTAQRTAGGSTRTIGLFIEDDWTLGRLVLTAGVRADLWRIGGGFFRELSGAGAINAERRFADRSGIEPTGRLGLVWRPTAGVALRAAGYTGFRLPTLNELYRPFTVFPVVTQANDALDLERLRGIEGGVDIEPVRGVSIALTGFYNRLEGAIANVSIGPNLRQRRNLDAIEARGIELSTTARRGPFVLNASYAFSDSRVRARGPLDGLVPAQSPRDSLSATLAWAPRGGPSLSATLRHVGRQFEDDLQTESLPPATTLDAVARLPIGHGFALVARGENLGDATVVTRNSGGSIDLGTPRTLWIGLRLGG